MIMKKILPEGMDIPGSFETVGSIAHINLREEYQPFKHVIGQVILDKNKHIKTVVNKVGNIDHTFRFFKMEVLAGEDNFITEVVIDSLRFMNSERIFLSVQIRLFTSLLEF
jgi:tRNA (guanine37-N1)-methyltransferase